MCLAGLQDQTAGRPSGPAPHSRAGRQTGYPKTTSGNHKQLTFFISDEQRRVQLERFFTSPAMGVGNLLIFLTRPGLIALSSLY